MLYKVVSMQEKCDNHPSARNTYVAALSLSENWHKRCGEMAQQQAGTPIHTIASRLSKASSVSQGVSKQLLRTDKSIEVVVAGTAAFPPPSPPLPKQFACPLAPALSPQSHCKPSAAQHLGSQRPLLSYFTPVHVPRPEGITCVLLTFSKSSRLRPVSRVLLCGE